jgi:hypothetical protein
MLLVLIGAAVAACSGDDVGAANDNVVGSMGEAAGATVAGAGGGVAGSNGSAGDDTAHAGAGGAIANMGGAGGSNAGGSGKGGAAGGAAGSAGISTNTDAGSEGTASGTIWYDGEPAGLAYSAGTASISAGSTASETTDNPHGGSKSMSVSLNASTGWGHLGWTPSLDHKSFDLTTHTTLEFWIRGVSGTPTAVQLEMHGPGGGCPWINVKDYLPGGVTMSWQKVSIPLSAFKMDQKKIQVVDFWLASGNAAFVIDDGRWN